MTNEAFARWMSPRSAAAAAATRGALMNQINTKKNVAGCAIPRLGFLHRSKQQKNNKKKNLVYGLN